MQNDHKVTHDDQKQKQTNLKQLQNDHKVTQNDPTQLKMTKKRQMMAKQMHNDLKQLKNIHYTLARLTHWSRAAETGDNTEKRAIKIA